MKTTGLMLVATLLAFGTMANAADLYVPEDYGTIQAAIDAAYDGEDIEVAPGTYYERVDFKGKAVGLYSRDGAASTTIDGGGTGSVVRCVRGEGAGTILEGFTIRGGNAANGGGMYNRSSSPTVIRCAFEDNYATSKGGGMYNNNSNPTVSGCTFSRNQGIGDGGGMANYMSSPTVSYCTFTENSTKDGGGGMHNREGSHPTVTDCTFEGNLADDGGGMQNYIDSSPTVSDCTFLDNVTSGNGGGIDNTYSSDATVTYCTFLGNSARWGGGMLNGWGSSPIIVNCVFFENEAQYYGGGMYNIQTPDPDLVTVRNCTFTDNSTAYSQGAGGICVTGSSRTTVRNCIVWDNSGGEVRGSPATLILAYSDVKGGWAGVGNIDEDPLFLDADGRLSAGSPCIDSGDSTVVEEATDLDWNPRIVGLSVDVGAYEFQEPVRHAAAKTAQLIDEVADLSLPQGIENSLNSKLEAVLRALGDATANDVVLRALDDSNKNDDRAPIHVLRAFINAVEAQRGKKISKADADALIAAAQKIIALLRAV